MSGGLLASCTKMRVAKPKVVTISARAIGTVARWVIVRSPLDSSRFRGPQVVYGGLGLLLGGVEPMVLYLVLVTLLDLGLLEVRPPDLLAEPIAQGRVQRRQRQRRRQGADGHSQRPPQSPALCS